MIARAETRATEAEAIRERALVEAEANRGDTFAKITNISAQADAVERKAASETAQLFAAADTVQRNGQAEIAKLEVQRDSALRRGQALSSQLLAEADSLEQSQRAVVAQMNEEIRAAEQILQSELTRMDQMATTFYEVAQATYEEAITIADTFASIAATNAELIAANNQADAEKVASDVTYTRQVAKATELAAQAAVERLMADATFAFEQAEAQDIVARARVASEARIAEAAAAAQFVIADANDRATHQQFQTRIVQTDSERNRAYAAEYLADRQRDAQVEQSIAAAQAYRELSARAINRFNQATQQFETAARRNWDARLAFPAPQPVTPSPDFFYTFTDPTFDGQPNNQVTTPGSSVEIVDVEVPLD